MCDLGEQTLSRGRDIREARVCGRAARGAWGSAGAPRSEALGAALHERCGAGETTQKRSGNKVWLNHRNTVFVEDTQ